MLIKSSLRWNYIAEENSKMQPEISKKKSKSQRNQMKWNETKWKSKKSMDEVEEWEENLKSVKSLKAKSMSKEEVQ